VRAFLVVMTVGVTPLLLVYGFGYFEKGLGARLLGNVRDGADDTAMLLETWAGRKTAEGTVPLNDDDLRPAVDSIAAKHDVRIRVLDRDGKVVLDVDREPSNGLWHVISDVWYGRERVLTPQGFDRTLEPVAQRPEVVEALATGRAAGCRTAASSVYLVCDAVRVVDPGSLDARVVYVQDSVPRAIGSFSDLRDQLGRLTLIVLPAALMLAWWLGWRFVVPIENLREQILAKAAVAAPRADVGLPRRDEFGDLATAFNDLLSALHERSKANEAFVADLAHEFKNPVAAVRAAGESLDRGAVDAERAARLASVLKESGRKLDALVTQFLELARAEAGLPDEPRAPVDVGAMCKGLAQAFANDERWRKVSFDAQSTGDTSIAGVALRLESALRNLVANAADFSGDGGKVTLLASGNTESVTVRVSDSGPGIAPEDLPRVFDRFFSTRRATGGTGLGLAMVRAVVEGHGGTVRALPTKPGEGAIFELTLPRSGY
jgi:signal transduction histidine kinase